MPAYLSEEWLDAARAALEAQEIDPPVVPPLAIAQRIIDGPQGEVSFVIAFDGRAATVRPGDGSADADLRFTQDYPTAAAIAQGTMSAQSAFMRGLLRVGGDISRMITAAPTIEAIGDVFAELRHTTTY
jgi:putative sterol carrier protein